MNRLLHLIILSAILSACSSSFQVIQTEPQPSLKKDAGQYVFENDTLRIRYSFWEDHGVMAFSIENKLPIPLYIDWRKSAFIRGMTKYNYYSDSEIKQTKNQQVYLYGAIYNWGVWFPTTISESAGVSVSQKEERITFIPPSSLTTKASHIIMPGNYIKMDGAIKKQITEEIKGLVLETGGAKSRITFRNFITYSTTENFTNESYVNNEFYVNKVIQVKRKYLNEFAAPDRFYIEMIDN